MARFTNQQVINFFIQQKPANGGALVSDGQSLFSYGLRIAEHVPKNGGACTIVYDYTSGGGNFISSTTSSHVGMIKQRVPKPNVMLVRVAKKAGLVS